MNETVPVICLECLRRARVAPHKIETTQCTNCGSYELVPQN